MPRMRDSILLVLCPPFWTKLPPLGLAYIDSYLRRKGHTVYVYDANIETYHTAPDKTKIQWHDVAAQSFQDSFYDEKCLQRVSNIVSEKKITILGFSVFRSNREFSIKCATAVKKAFPHVRIIFGGPEVKRYALEKDTIPHTSKVYYADHFIVGEGEVSMNEVCVDIASNIFFHTAKEERNLEALGYPDFSQFDLSKYERKRALPIIASRGCIRKCSFCSERLLTSMYRMRSAEHIIEEIKTHCKKYSTLWFTFHDSLINGDLKKLEDLCDGILAEKIHIKWDTQCAIRGDMSERLFKKMKDSGCFNIFIGLESGSNKVLKSVQKGFDSEEASTFLKKIYNVGIHAEVSLITGLPNEGEEDFEETLVFLRKNKRYIPKIAQVNPFIPRAGTEAACDGRVSMDTYREKAKQRTQRLCAFLQENEFTFTKAFINNLVYED